MQRAWQKSGKWAAVHEEATAMLGLLSTSSLGAGATIVHHYRRWDNCRQYTRIGEIKLMSACQPSDLYNLLKLPLSALRWCGTSANSQDFGLGYPLTVHAFLHLTVFAS